VIAEYARHCSSKAAVDIVAKYFVEHRGALGNTATDILIHLGQNPNFTEIMDAMARMEIPKLAELTSLDSLVLFNATRPLILRFCAGLTINSLMFQLSNVKWNLLDDGSPQKAAMGEVVAERGALMMLRRALFCSCRMCATAVRDVGKFSVSPVAAMALGSTTFLHVTFEEMFSGCSDGGERALMSTSTDGSLTLAAVLDALPNLQLVSLSAVFQVNANGQDSPGAFAYAFRDHPQIQAL
jgi:hypothetical protein